MENTKISRFPSMTFRQYIKRWAIETKNGYFWCEMCGCFINKQRWIHFKTYHRKVWRN